MQISWLLGHGFLLAQMIVTGIAQPIVENTASPQQVPTSPRWVTRPLHLYAVNISSDPLSRPYTVDLNIQNANLLVTIDAYHNFVSNLNSTAHASIQQYGRDGVVDGSLFEAGSRNTIFVSISSWYAEMNPLTWGLLYDTFNFIYDGALQYQISGQIPLLSVNLFDDLPSGGLRMSASGLIGKVQAAAEGSIEQPQVA